jgi:hypothetical protein
MNPIRALLWAKPRSFLLMRRSSARCRPMSPTSSPSASSAARPNKNLITNLIRTFVLSDPYSFLLPPQIVRPVLADVAHFFTLCIIGCAGQSLDLEDPPANAGGGGSKAQTIRIRSNSMIQVA